MTEPTQAQIEGKIERLRVEAAAKSFYERGGDKHFPWETEKETIKVIYRKHAKAALTAAAEVGELDTDPVTRGLIDRRIAVLDTIERCARVAEQVCQRSGQPGKIIGAALRALKDKP